MGKGKNTGGKGGGGHSRSAITGKYVSDRYAKTHPKTTVTERPPKKKGK